MKQAFSKIRNKIFRRMFIDNGNSVDDTVLLAGTGRSGTTWLGDIINFNNDYRNMFEPCHPGYTREYSGFHNKQYRRPDDDDEEFHRALLAILTGSIKNPWVDQFNARFLCDRRLVKEIRANLFLKWIKINFPCVPIIFILRHPCAVANSKILLGWNPKLDDYLAQDELMAEQLSQQSELIDDIKRRDDWFEKIICQWCIENYVPLNQFDRDEMHVVFYENLCRNPLEETRAVLAWLKTDYDPKVETVFSRPSELSEKHSAVVTGKDLISGWQKNIDPKLAQRAVEIMRAFNLDSLYDHRPAPLVPSVWDR